MRIAIPLKENEFCLHFNNCDQFAIVKIGAGTDQIIDASYMTPPSLNLIALPRWFRENEIDIILAGGMDQHVQDFLNQNHIEVRVGFLEKSIKGVIEKFISGQIRPGETTETKK
jgi:predicted Fe-Mo cluster-binding NifX family protein